MALVTAERYFGRRLRDGARRNGLPHPEVYAKGCWWREDIEFPGACDGAVARPAARALVNWGRWIVPCPFCPAAQLAVDGDRRFLCVDCGNESVGFKSVRVQWPGAVLRQRIEELLLARPVENQHWVPGQTAADLARENQQRGL